MVNFSITVVPDLGNNYSIYLALHTLWGVGRETVGTKTENKNKTPSLTKVMKSFGFCDFQGLSRILLFGHDIKSHRCHLVAWCPVAWSRGCSFLWKNYTPFEDR